MHLCGNDGIDGCLETGEGTTDSISRVSGKTKYFQFLLNPLPIKQKTITNQSYLKRT